MNEQYQRTAVISVDTLQVVGGDVNTGLRVTFDIEANLKPEPNTASVKVYNLNEGHRKQLEELEEVVVSVEAGYLLLGNALLFQGLLGRAFTLKDGGGDYITTIESGDGQKQYQRARINLAFKKGTPIKVVVQKVAKALGVGMGNAGEQKLTFDLGGGNTLKQSLVINGNAARELGRLFKATGKEWSIQNEALQVIDRNLALQHTAILLSPGTGLIGSPTVDNKGVMKCTALMQPDIIPGRQLVIDARNASGNYRIESVKYRGDTAADDWFAEIEGKRL